MTQHVNHQQNHLQKCKKYLEECASREAKLQPSLTLAASFAAPSTAKSTGRKQQLGVPGPGPLVQQQLVNVDTLTIQQQTEFDNKCAMATYTQCMPFTIWEGPEVKDFLTSLRPAYKPPSAYQLSGSLLGKNFEIMKSTIDRIIKESPSIDLIIDESSTIGNSRIINVSVHTASGVFFYETSELPADEIDADWLADFIEVKVVPNLCGGIAISINSLATDTCQTMRSLWAKLKHKAQYNHTFFIPCDSHGIQLLIKDILTSKTIASWLNETFKNAQKIATFFSNAKKQLAFLRQHQKRLYNSFKSFVIAGETRWGTQYNMLSSVMRSKDALRDFAEDHRANCRPIKNTLLDSTFWCQLDDLMRLLKPLHEFQVESEGSSSHMGFVYPRWLRIMAHINKQRDVEFRTQLVTITQKRMDKQTTNLHVLAFLLNPHYLKLYELTAEWQD